MTVRTQRWFMAALIGVLLLGLAAIAPKANASSPNIVISQVYGGGGNSGATLKNDYIELFNKSAAPINVTGWTVQYASASGTSWTNTTTLPSATIQAGQYYLIQEAAGTGGTQNLPTPDFTGSINLSGTNGKLALVSSGTVCAGIDCLNAPRVDFIGYGTANAFEGTAAAPTTSSAATSLSRVGGGCTDNDQNSTDFADGATNPRNTLSPFNVCGGGGPTATATSTGTVTNTPNATATITATATATNTPGAVTRIHDIQGAQHISPLVSIPVSNVPGIVTAVKSNGFWIQEEDAFVDGNIGTSEGIFVFTSSTPPVAAAVGNKVTVSGTVFEFRAATANITTTEITTPTVTLVTNGNPLPAVTVIGAGGRLPPTTVINDDGTGNIESSGTFDPAQDGIDFYESLEGMRVQVNNAVAVSATTSNGEVALLPDNGTNPGAGPRTARGGIYVTATDFNPEYIIMDDALTTVPLVHVGATFPGAIVGVMDYSFGMFKLLAQTIPAPVASTITREATNLLPVAGKLTIGTFNVENLAPGDPSSKYVTLADLVVNNMKAPDIITIEEIQDNNGATNDSVVDASTTWGLLINAITAASGPTYSFRQINPVDDQDGGQPGGNIRVGFLYNPARVSFVDRGTCGSTTITTVTNSSGFPLLNCSPGRIDPTNTAWNSSRKPLVGEFTFNGQTVFVIGNHFNSKGGDDPLYGKNQPPIQSSQVQRNQQAALVNGFVQQIAAINANANVVVLGDINDFQFSTPVQTLKGTVLDNLFDLLAPNQQYSYLFNGNSQVLDQILTSHNLFNNQQPEFDVVHVNAEFYDQASDHDPSVARFNFGVIATATPTSTPTPALPDTVGAYLNGVFYLRNSNTAGPADIIGVFGGDASDLPVAGDWNGDGVDTVGVYRNSIGIYFLSDSNTAPSVVYAPVFGNPGDTPFAGRWTADMTHDGIGVYRNSNGILFQKKVLTTGFSDFFAVFGNPGDQGIAGDWEGNGFDSVGIYRTFDQSWFLSNNSTPSGITFSDIAFGWDIGTSSPVVGDWDANVSSTVGYLTAGGVFTLHSTNATVGTDNTFAFGPTGAKPISGKWFAPARPPVVGSLVNPVGVNGGLNGGSAE